MDILQTVWTAQTTENEGLISITGILFCFIDAYVYMLLFSTILNIPTTRKTRIIYVIILSILGYLCKIIIPNPYSIFVNMLLLPICVYFIFKSNILKSIIAEIITFSISLILEFIVERFFMILTNFPLTSIINIPIYRISIILIIYAIVYILYRFLKHLNFSVKFLESMNKKTKILLFINLVLAVFVLITQFYLLSCYSDNLSSIMSFLNILSLIAYFIISIVSFSNITRLETTSTSLEEATLYNKTLEILYDNTRAFKHDFGNIVQGIGGYINNNDMEGLKKYYSQLMEDCQRVNNLTTLSPKVINNPAIYNVMANKYHKADEKGIKINLEVFLDLNNLHMKIYEFTRILGILMDNAIEAACECENKIINVCFRKKGNMQLLIIENTYLDKDINTDNIYKKGFSTKKGNSGLGLWEVRQILKKNSNLNLHTTKKDNFFSQQFEIYIE